MRTRHDSNIDPFNAGEPVMPEDTLPDDFAGDACSFTDKDYSAPRKRPDAYRAPSDDASGRTSGNGSVTAPKRAAFSWLKTFGATGSEAKKYTQPSGRTQDRPSPKKSANGKKIVLLVLLIFIVGNVCALLSSELEDTSLSSFIHDDDSVTTSRAAELDISELDEDERTVFNAADQTLSGLKDNEHVRERICSDFSQELKNSYGYDAEELGINPTDYADRLLYGFTYQMDSVFAFTDNDDSGDNRGSVFFDYFVPSAYDFDEALYEDLNGYLDTEGLARAHGELTDAQKERVRQIYNDALDEIDVDDDDASYGSLEFDYDSASKSFNLKERSFNEFIDSAFELY